MTQVLETIIQAVQLKDYCTSIASTEKVLSGQRTISAESFDAEILHVRGCLLTAD